MIFKALARQVFASRLPLSGLSGKPINIPEADSLEDADRTLLTNLLPWNDFVLDAHGRRFDAPYSARKHHRAQTIPDPRIADFDERFGVKGKAVLELGCFDGMHSASFAQLGAQITAVSSRIENVCKTIVRCGSMHLPVKAHVWDVEKPVPETLDLDCDFLSHIGVLYHLADPVAYLNALLPNLRQAILMDTHIAPQDRPLQTYEVDGKTYMYYRFNESKRSIPFAGIYDHAKWLTVEILEQILTTHGFNLDRVERCDERNGPHELIHACQRSPILSPYIQGGSAL